MKLKFLAAFLMLAALGCAEPSSDTTPATDSGETTTTSSTDTTDSGAATTATVEPATDTDTLLASTTTVKFDVTGMK